MGGLHFSVVLNRKGKHLVLTLFTLALSVTWVLVENGLATTADVRSGNGRRNHLQYNRVDVPSCVLVMLERKELNK